ncbi:unnamed protein product [Protopolystoma xenopodis]|uniref:Uncharacterized protein n=1 Tax=Protopolystoma xenopodis TaxID=117903 RepID=A0A3S5A3N9_9PLAT|nr:unnamed protein product [Protopolystoma xenopodis]
MLYYSSACLTADLIRMLTCFFAPRLKIILGFSATCLLHLNSGHLSTTPSDSSLPRLKLRRVSQLSSRLATAFTSSSTHSSVVSCLNSSTHPATAAPFSDSSPNLFRRASQLSLASLASTSTLPNDQALKLVTSSH